VKNWCLDETAGPSLSGTWHLVPGTRYLLTETAFRIQPQHKQKRPAFRERGPPRSCSVAKILRARRPAASRCKSRKKSN